MQNYSATERECHSVVWAVTILRPYTEGQKFVVRTDHDKLRWQLTLNDPSGRLMRWRLRLSEFDFEIQYRPGRASGTGRAVAVTYPRWVRRSTRGRLHSNVWGPRRLGRHASEATKLNDKRYRHGRGPPSDGRACIAAGEVIFAS